jgi:hypothetical protein
VLADRHRLTVYDAWYLELSLRTVHSLATLDGDLERAAPAEHAPLAGTPLAGVGILFACAMEVDDPSP